MQLEIFAARVVTKISLDVHANLVARPSEGGTPIDTSWASSNWIPSVGERRTQTTGTPERVSTQVQEQGVGELLSYTLAKGPAFIQNNVPYITALNDGWSPQAQAGFVERAIEKAVRQDLTGLAA